MRRRAFIAMIGGVGVAWPFAAIAQSVHKARRIGLLWPGTNRSSSVVSVVDGLRELGYIDGQNVVIEYRFATDNEQLAALAADLVRANVDVIVAPTTPAAAAATEATKTIPIVFTAVVDPVEKGFVASLARPGGNATGVAMIMDPAKPLELLKEAVPAISHVTFVYDPATRPGAFLETSLTELQKRARALEVTTEVAALARPDEADRVFAALPTDTNALLLDTTRYNFLARERICALAMQRRLPTASVVREMTDVGCLISYGENLLDTFRRAASYIDKILKGSKPSDLPVEQPTKFELVVNLKTAKALGLTIPAAVLARADEVIE
jgi:putative ABC transport system substrate-binding protein